MEILVNKIKSLPEYQHLLGDLAEHKVLPGLALPRSVRLPILAALFSDSKKPVLFITDRADRAIKYFDELAFWLPEGDRYFFPEPNPLFYENASWGPTTRRDRLQALTALSQYHLPSIDKPNSPPVIITSARAIMTKTMPRRDFLKSILQLSVGQEIDPTKLLQKWVEIGYQPSEMVLEPGQFSHRGGLLDIWSIAEDNPVRMDFFGNEIDAIRQFGVGSQRTIRKLEKILISPAREYLLHSSSQIEQNELSEFHIPLIHPTPSNVLDYLPNDALVFFDDIGNLEGMVSEVEEAAVKYRAECIQEGTLQNDYPVPYFSWSEINESLGNQSILELGRSTAIDGAQDLSLQFGRIERFGGRLDPFIDYLSGLNSKGNASVIVSRQSSRLEELWKQKQPAQANPALEQIDNDVSPQNNPIPQKPGSILFLEDSLSEGWSLGDTYLITDSEIFGWERPQPRQRPQTNAENPEAAYADLKPGDWVVHVDFGIGRFIGLVQRRLEGLEREYLCVEYKNGDQLFVPIYQADRLTRYLGPDGSPPSPGSLGTQEWQETKRKTRSAVIEVAQELLDLYARRQIAVGYAFSPDTAWQKELESAFPYYETEDQIKAINDIKRDMESDRPMDRLLCGDVGYGKTEVALRSAFKAVMDGKQVAVLVPTTVLAQQHFDTFRQRLSAFPLAVEMLSRFRTQKEQEEIIKGLAEGAVDIVIGTHRLISSDVKFKNLGLVIIDEEQRFGVTHKEHLKKLRTEVDILTLTATPIPRTLYMALTGVRDISNLSTPPEERLPIVTHIGPYSPKIVQQAITRELERGGQVFFVHNRVQTISGMYLHLEKLVTEAKIAIAHGQMPEHELADVMHRYTAGEIDILLCTSIIESGLDIPNSNTLIVDRADTFGLAQLYQLRGRVGRGAVRAYAYFFRHKKFTPTLEGQERLEIIAENTQLGAGYSIAMRDLEMRGAGELLGARQSGHIAAVGFHLYTRLLASAVGVIRKTHGEPETKLPSTISSGIELPVSVDLPIPAGIPMTYIQNNNLRIRLYRRLADISDMASLEALAAEFEDRFGPIPEEVEGLFYQMKVKILAQKVGLAAVGFEAGQIILRYPPPPEGREVKRFHDLSPEIRGGKNAFWCTFYKDKNWRERLLATLEKLETQRSAS